MDPRAENCREYREDAAGRVIGVELRCVPHGECKYELVRAELIGEEAAAGNIAASCLVLDRGGVPVGDTVYLAWPFPDLVERLGPGNPDNQHMITNGYVPPALGPLALYVGNAGGGVNSDVVGGLGLPKNRHVCYRLVWRERGAVEPPVTPPPATAGDVAAAVQGLAQALSTGLAALAAAIDRLRGGVVVPPVTQPGPPAPAQPPANPLAFARYALGRPLKVGDVTQWFGENPENYQAFGLAGHEGIDYGVPAGTEVYAAHAGQVAGAHEEGAYGLHVVLEDAGAGVSTVYAHLSEVCVAVGESVAVGALVGRSGNSGRSSGAHLHFGWQVDGVRNPAYGDWLDPALGRELYKRLNG